MHNIEAGKIEEILNVFDCGPVQKRLRILQAKSLSEDKDRMPKVAVPVYDDLRIGVTNSVQSLEYGTNVIEKADQIG